jgi:hypothetical protein
MVGKTPVLGFCTRILVAGIKYKMFLLFRAKRCKLGPSKKWCMSIIVKLCYEAPKAEVLEVRNEGIICASGGGANPSNPFSGGGNPLAEI